MLLFKEPVANIGEIFGFQDSSMKMAVLWIIISARLWEHKGEKRKVIVI